MAWHVKDCKCALGSLTYTFRGQQYVAPVTYLMCEDHKAESKRTFAIVSRYKVDAWRITRRALPDLRNPS